MAKRYSLAKVVCGAALVLWGAMASADIIGVKSADKRDNVNSVDFYGDNDVRVVQDYQVWIPNVLTLPNNFYISGNGWNSGEQFGALRFASGTSAANCATISGNVILEGDARVSSRNGNDACFGKISGNISGDFQLEVNSRYATGNGGTVVLTGENTYANTLITCGVLQIGEGNASGTLGTGSVTLADAGQLAFDRSDAVTLSNTLVGTAASRVVQRGLGTLTIGADVSGFNGTYEANNGTLTWSGITNAAKVVTSGTGLVDWGSVTNVTNFSVGSTLDYSAIFKEGVTFVNNPTVVAGGVVDLKGVSFHVAESKLTLSGGKITDSTGTSGYDVNGTATFAGGEFDLPVYLATEGGSNMLNVEGTNSATLNKVVQNKDGFTSQKVIKTGTGSLALKGANTYDGNTQVQQGTLILDKTNGGSIVGNVQIDSGAVFQVNRDDDKLVIGNKISGNGTWLTVTPDASTIQLSVNAAALTDLDNFTGVLAFQGQRLSVNWNDVAGRTLEVRNTGQFWIGDAKTISNPLIIAGDGWSSSERRGAIRFQAAVTKNADESDMTMTTLSGPITMTANSRICPYGDANLVYAMISGQISGNYNLNVNGIQDTRKTNRLILTGSNTYGATTVDNAVLQIGHVGKVNGVTYDGTSGTLGAGKVSLSANANLNFNRTDTYTFNYEIANAGGFNVNSGTFSLTNNLTGAGTTTIAAGATLQTDSVARLASTQKLAGAGTWLIQTPTTSGAMVLDFTGKDLTGFTGTIAMQNWRTSGGATGWDSFSGKTIEIRDSAQLWIKSDYNGDFSDATTNFRITGNGWKGTNNENRGAIRFNTYWNAENPTVMQHLKANVEIVDSALIMLYADGKEDRAAMSGVISGGTMNYSTELDANRLILLGANTYGATNIKKGTLQVGHVGDINGVTYDGTTGTLGTGKVTIANAAALDIQRDAYTISNEIENNGTFQVGRGTTTLTGGMSGANTGNMTILEGATLIANPTADATINSRLIGAGTFEKTGAKTLSIVNDSTATPRFSGTIHVKEGTLNISLTPSYDGLQNVDHPLGKELIVDSGATVNFQKAHQLGWKVKMTTPIVAGTLDLGGDQFLGDIVMNGGLLKSTAGGHRVRGDISTLENSGTSTITARLNMLDDVGSSEDIKPFKTDGTHTFNIAAGSTLDFQGLLTLWTAGDGKLVKTGEGTLILSNTGNMYNHALDIQQGTVAVDGKYAGAIIVSGGTLAGKGTITGAISMAGGNSAIEATPGGKMGTLVLNKGLTLDGTLLADIRGYDSYDKITSAGNISIAPGSKVGLTVLGGFIPTLEDVGTKRWDLLVGQAGDLTDFDLSDISLVDSLITGSEFQWMLGITPDGSTLYAALGVPEPAAWALLLLSLFGLAGLRKFGTRKAR